MDKRLKFVYVIVHFLALFLAVMNVEAHFQCHIDSECENQIKCVLPRVAKCVRYKCDCVRFDAEQDPWSART
ncbi:Nodule Cysteine-Rich (NCR) secreted peptide [Medicago truncatula]|uniref:Nodule Cysteine-Rich (NCR) secreted peptide n=2 Tax=Medicago truncatula TaxID=3880 RepID=A0A072VID4_MEDTR|nr:Nodule Cysteine-Rich (NCR) secreted peptide [Medicago truncatula]